MKLTRNKIRKIRKQQQQSVRKWKKARKSMRRRAATFRRSRQGISTVANATANANDSSDTYPLKLKNVFNKTLKRYIPLPVLSYLKQRYQNMKRMRRKQRRDKMIGGGDASVITTPPAPNAAPNADPKAAPNADPKAAPNADPKADPKAAPSEKKSSIGPEITGDLSIKTLVYELKKIDETYQLLEFLVKNGLPYYIQIEMKSDGKKFNRHDTEIFDLRRILIGKFATNKDFETDGKIPDKKRDLYFKPSDQIGIADGDTIGNEHPNDVFIYTGEKGVPDPTSTDDSIKIAIAGSKNEPVVMIDSKRLYKLLDGSPESIDDFDTVLKYGDKVDPSEFRIQVAPLSEDDFKKAVATSSDGDNKKGKKIITDDTNSYVVNLSVGCKVTSIQTLLKSLEIVRMSLEDEEDDSKTKASDVFKMLIDKLNDPEFVKNDGYDDFKKSVYGFSYKIPGKENKYGIAQMSTFFTEKSDSIPPAVVKEFTNLLRLLDKGPMGENGACAAFDMPGLPLDFKTKVIPLANGDIREVTRLTNKGNITGIAQLLGDLNAASNAAENDAKKDAAAAEAGSEGEKDAAAAAEGNKNAAEGNKNAAAAAAAEDNKKAAAAAAAAAAMTVVAAATAKSAPAASASAETLSTTTTEHNNNSPIDSAANTNTRPLSKDDIKEIDAIDSQGERYKAYLVRKFNFSDLEDMNMVHFIGWGKETDEYIPDSEATNTENPKILKRNNTTKTGNGGITDMTIDDFMNLYKNDDMAKLEGTARAKAEEYKKKQEETVQLKKLGKNTQQQQEIDPAAVDVNVNTT